jgi:hypothetical protein
VVGEVETRHVDRTRRARELLFEWELVVFMVKGVSGLLRLAEFVVKRWLWFVDEARCSLRTAGSLRQSGKRLELRNQIR